MKENDFTGHCKLELRGSSMYVIHTDIIGIDSVGIPLIGYEKLVQTMKQYKIKIDKFDNSVPMQTQRNIREFQKDY